MVVVVIVRGGGDCDRMVVVVVGEGTETSLALIKIIYHTRTHTGTPQRLTHTLHKCIHTDTCSLTVL